MDIEADIKNIVKRLQRSVEPDRGVYPFMVQSWLDIYRAEGTLRRDMSTMAERGELLRIGGPGARKGYRFQDRVPGTQIEIKPVEHEQNVRYRDVSFLKATWMIISQAG